MQRVAALQGAQIDTLLAWFDDLWWTSGRTRADVETMLQNCVVVAFEDRNRSLVGFARVISDHVYKALVLDVVVDPEHRKTGLGATLMDAVLAHPAVVGCGHVELYCAPDLVGFYERYGFTTELGTLRFMRRAR